MGRENELYTLSKFTRVLKYINNSRPQIAIQSVKCSLRFIWLCNFVKFCKGTETMYVLENKFLRNLLILRKLHNKQPKKFYSSTKLGWLN
jgi:hypothetical protein